MRFIIYLWASYIYWLFCSDPQSPAKDKRRKFLQGSRSSYDFYQTTAGDGSDIRDQSSNSVRADQGQSESCANEVLSTARGAEQQLTAEIDRELNAIIKITLGRAKGTSASSRWDILVLSLIKIFSSFFFWICPHSFRPVPNSIKAYVQEPSQLPLKCCKTAAGRETGATTIDSVKQVWS